MRKGNEEKKEEGEKGEGKERKEGREEKNLTNSSVGIQDETHERGRERNAFSPAAFYWRGGERGRKEGEKKEEGGGTILALPENSRRGKRKRGGREGVVD